MPVGIIFQSMKPSDFSNKMDYFLSLTSLFSNLLPLFFLLHQQLRKGRFSPINTLLASDTIISLLYFHSYSVKPNEYNYALNSTAPKYPTKHQQLWFSQLYCSVQGFELISFQLMFLPFLLLFVHLFCFIFCCCCFLPEVILVLTGYNGILLIASL